MQRYFIATRPINGGKACGLAPPNKDDIYHTHLNKNLGTEERIHTISFIVV